MSYFCDVHIQSGRDTERRIFIVLDEPRSEVERPQLTKDFLLMNNQYKEFVQQYRPKLVLVDYTVYQTETEVYASSQDEVFEELLQNKQANRIGQSELSIDCSKEKGTKSRRKKRMSPAMKVCIGGGVLLICVVTFGLGNMLGKLKAQSTGTESAVDTLAPNEDGMIIPEQPAQDNIEDAQQITISIDRSYSAVPKEDLQLKGTVVDGVAKITLPEFDKTDFFTHVTGHTWGFTTDPDGKKIEYYGGSTYDFAEDTKLYRVLVKYGGGNGTKEDPYLIDYYDQLELMGEEQARGYFRQTADIVFPTWATHKPINTVNELKSKPDEEHFEYDGGGYLIQAINAPLFGKVTGAVIKNVNIKSSVIESTEYKNYGFIVCEAYNYRYESDGKSYETGETLISNCSVSHSVINAKYPEVVDDTAATEVVTAPVVVPPDLVTYDENGNVITEPDTPVEQTKHGEFAIGAITGLGGQIENCYVTDFEISAGLDNYFLYAGGISGKPASVKNSAVYAFAAQGNIFTAGGIVGNAGGARLYEPTGKELPNAYGGCIQGCLARNIILSTELSAGGIAGEGSTNAENAVIANCYANELQFSAGVYEDDKRQILKKAGDTGGIIGIDGKENKGHLVMNTVSPAEMYVIGSKKKSSYDDTVRLAPAYAFYQENILTVLNKNTVHPDAPKEIYTGNFEFGESAVFGDATGSLPYPAEIAELFEKTIVEVNQ